VDRIGVRRCCGAASCVTAFWLASALWWLRAVAWFVYNAAAFGDWLEFARGPYSAKAIELRTAHARGRRIPVGTIPGSRCCSS
jgi:hypothetical protein